MTRRHRRRGGADHGGHENEERWLLTYPDMITLLMALFMVLFSMAVVNKSKLSSLQQSLKEGFKPHILPGGSAIKETGAQTQTPQVAEKSPGGHMRRLVPDARANAAAVEQEQLRRLQVQVQHQARSLGLD